MSPTKLNDLDLPPEEIEEIERGIMELYNEFPEDYEKGSGIISPKTVDNLDLNKSY
jgi:hypothetical protein